MTRIFSTRRAAWLRQDGVSYTRKETDAGKWSLAEAIVLDSATNQRDMTKLVDEKS